MIKNFGHYWSRELVQWGERDSGQRKGTLLGWRSSFDEECAEVDFREQIGIYCLFGENREIVYVGQVGAGSKQRLFDRLKQHTYGRLEDRWSHFSWFGFRETEEILPIDQRDGVVPLKPFVGGETENSDSLNLLEGMLIQLLEPRLNRQGSRWKNTLEFYQWYEEYPASNQEIYEEVRRLRKKLRKLKRALKEA